MIISGGVNIYPAEIEAVIHEHPGVIDVAVFGIPDDEWGERVHAIVQPKAGVDLDLDELRAFVEARAGALQAAARLRAARRAAPHRVRQAAEARAARRVLARPRVGGLSRMSGSPDRTLSEFESKQLLARTGSRWRRSAWRRRPTAAVAAAAELGYPVVVKLTGDAIAHKTERGLVRLGLADRGRGRGGCGRSARRGAARRRRGRVARRADGPRLARADRRAAHRPAVRAVRDARHRRRARRGRRRRRVPAGADRPGPTPTRCSTRCAAQALLGPFRGEPAVDRDALAATLRRALAARRAGTRRRVGRRQPAHRRRRRADRGRRPGRARPEGSTPGDAGAAAVAARPSTADFAALFEPRGVIVAGASSHPGKFGFVALHNILSQGYAGRGLRDQPRGRRGPRRPDGRPRVDELPAGAVVDLVFVCTPAGANPELLRACARRGIRAAFVTSAGYGEAGDDGRAGRARAGRARRRARHPARRPERAGRRVDARRRCARRSSRRTRPPAGSRSRASRATSCRRS